MNSDLTQYWKKTISGLRHLIYYLRHVGWRFVDDGCQGSAAALTYMTLFAVVPMMTVMYSMFAMIPSFQEVGNQVRDLIFSNFIPSAGAEIQDYLIQFSNQARRLGAVGAAVLFITSYLMLSNIEKSFNRIWAAPGKRLGVSSFLLYWAVLSLGPLLIGAGLVMNTYILSLQLLDYEYLQIGDGIHLLFEYLPWMLTAMAFTLLYKAVPNCTVPFKNALLGGIVATLFFELAKSIFSALVAQTSYTNIYGAFAILPLFLFWIYVCWIIILAGAEFVRALETFSIHFRGRQYSELLASLIALWQLWKAQKTGDQLSDFDVIRSGISASQWRLLRDRFMAHKIIVPTESGRFILARDLDDLSVWDLVESGKENFADAPADVEHFVEAYPWYAQLGPRICEIDQRSRKILSEPLAKLFDSAEEPVKSAVGETPLAAETDALEEEDSSKGGADREERPGNNGVDS